MPVNEGSDRPIKIEQNRSTEVIKSLEFPEDIERRLDLTLASVNASPKSVVLLLIPEHSFISPKELRILFKESYEGTEFELTHHNTPIDFCNYLYRLGMVRKKVLVSGSGYEKIIGYSLTQAGKKYGKPAAVLALNFEHNNKISLFETFAFAYKQHDSDNRVPYIRARLLFYLAKKKAPISIADLVKEFGIQDVQAKRNLRSLANAGVVDYESHRGHGVRSEVSVNEKGRLVDSGFLVPLESLVSDDQEVSEEIGLMVPAVLDNLHEIAKVTLFEYWKRSHSYKNRHSQLNMQILVLRVPLFPGEINAGELADAVDLSTKQVRIKLGQFIDSGSIGVRRVGGGYNIYSRFKHDRISNVTLKRVHGFK